MKDPARFLQERRDAGLTRQRRVMDGRTGVEQRVDGEPMLLFCSNDYLGLAGDVRIANALARAAGQYGAGSGASHLVSGHHRAHHELEAELADFAGVERALLFSTGYMANLAAVTGLCGRDDGIYEDRLNHASLIDAVRLSRARPHRYGHADSKALAERLARDKPAGGMIVTDALFSMDGDLAPLADLQALSDQHGLWLLADDAHGFGVLGAGGSGSFAHLGVSPGSRTLRVGTLGKAFGVFGAFVAGSQEAIELLVQSARTYIYTTALPAAVADAVRESLRILRNADDRRAILRDRISAFRAGAGSLGLPLLPSETPIQGIVLGSAERAVAASEHLLRRGILVPAIRPPTVPEGSARLRITFSSAHTGEHVERLLDALPGMVKE